MSITDDLKQEFKTRYPTLEVVAEKFLGKNKREAYRDFHAGKIPFPAFKLVKSQKAPLIVDINHLAKYLDQCAITAQEQQD